MRPFILASVISAALGAHHFEIVNKCPATINVYQDGDQIGTLNTGDQMVKHFEEDFTGHFSTDANGGSASAVSTTVAGFYAPYNFSYIIRDPEYINVGLRVAPINRSPSNGFCLALECNTLGCTDAFDRQPRVSAIPPPQPGVPPTPPMAACNEPDTGYQITFCPTGLFPNATHVPTEIHPLVAGAKCVDVRGAQFTNGTPVQIYDCNGSSAQRWLLTHFATKVQVAGTNFCLDSGTNPTNGSPVKIWQCFDNLDAQAWYYNTNGNIKLANHNLCLDLTNGNVTNGNQFQVWECAVSPDFNSNQIFNTE